MSKALYDLANDIIYDNAAYCCKRSGTKQQWLDAAQETRLRKYDNLVFLLNMEKLNQILLGLKKRGMIDWQINIDDWIDNCFDSDEEAFRHFGIDSANDYSD